MWGQGTCFGVPFQWFSLLKRVRLLPRQHAMGAESIRNLGSPVGPAVCGRRRGGARDVVVAEVIRNQRWQQPSVVRCYAPMSRLGPCIAQACRALVASDGVAGAKRGVLVAEALVRLRYE